MARNVLSESRRYNQTAHRFNRPSERVTIINPIHPLHGQEVAVRSFRYLGKSLRVIVEHPDGGLLSLPASKTSLELKGPSLQVEGKTPKFEPSRLLRLVEWLAKKDSAATSEISLGQQHQEIVPRKIDDTTAQITQSHSPGNGRPQPALNQSDSEIGGQNAQREKHRHIRTGGAKLMSSKIKKTHLERRAVVYLRQSTPQQVESNRESTERQYALANRAQFLGWDASLIQILDGDLGKSGQTTTGREDFHQLMAAVGLGEVGAVFALEASRFSRSQADWHKLLDICALTDTLVIDHDGVYDPNDFNDRVLLGFKGTWSHTELHGMRLRLQGAKLNKAKKGELRCAPPTGYVYDLDGNLVFDPDESVVAAIRLVFQQFRLLGTAFKVMRYFALNQIPFPRRLWRPGEIGTLHWGPVNHSRITAILHNPTYTGTYVYGRRRSLPVIESGQIARVKIQQLAQEDWKVVIHQAHPAYISWEEYLENSEQLARNHTFGMSDGKFCIPREGSALIQGLVICGKCGRRMSPRYYDTGGKRASYECNQQRKQNGQVGICWTAAAAAIDKAKSGVALLPALLPCGS